MRMTTDELVKRGFEVAKSLPKDAADLMKELSTRLDASMAVTRQACEDRRASAAEAAYLLDLAAGELNTSWMLHKTMLGAQAALICVAQGDIKSARDWLEGTTDEAISDTPEEITVAGLEAWFDSEMVSSDGKNGFLTRQQAKTAIRANCPSTDTQLAELRAHDRAEGINFAASRLAAAFNQGFVDKPLREVWDVVRMILSAKEDLANDPIPAPDVLSGEYAEQALKEWEAQLRQGAAL